MRTYQKECILRRRIIMVLSNTEKYYIILLFFFFIMLPASEVSAEWYAGGTIDTRYTYEQADSSTSNQISTEGLLSLSQFSDFYTFKSDFRVDQSFLIDEDELNEFDDISPEQIADAVHLHTFRFEFYPLENAALSIGRFTPNFGQSEFFNPLQVFSQTDYESLLKGDISSASDHRFIVKASLFGSSFSGDIFISPFLPAFKAFPVESPWFPDGNIPKEIYTGNPDLGYRTLNSISYGDANIEVNTDTPISLLARFGGSLPRLDFSLFGYWGIDTDFPLRSNAQIDDSTTYSLTLIPQYSRIFSTGAAISSYAQNFRFFLDMFYTPNKLFGTSWYKFVNFFDAIKLDQEMVETDSLKISAGGSLDLPEINSFIQCEYADQIIFKEEEKNIPDQLFSNVFTLLFRNTHDIISADVIFMLSLNDDSYVIFPSITAAFSEEFSLKLSSPLFFGEKDSNFGQYANHDAVILSCSLRF